MCILKNKTMHIERLEGNVSTFNDGCNVWWYNGSFFFLSSYMFHIFYNLLVLRI